VRTLQVPTLSARAMPDVPNPVAAATKLANPHANSKELIVVFINFVNFVFISVISFFLGL
jgi:hypothetical protein